MTGRPGGTLRPAGVRRVLASHALASVAMSLPWPLLLLLVWEDTGSAALLGLAGAARMLPYVLFSWAVARVADHHRRDRIVQATLLARFVLLGAMAALLATGHVLAAVLAAAAAVAVATPAYPALAAAMPAAAGPGRAARATSLLVTVEVASFVVGPALGGLLLAPSARVLVAPLSLAGVATAALLMIRIGLPAPGGAGSPEAAYGVRSALRRSPALRGAIAAVAAVNAVLAAVGVALLPLAGEAWQAGGTTYGLATGVLGFGALAGTVAHPDRQHRPGPGPRRAGARRRLPGRRRADPVAGVGAGAAGGRRRGRRPGRVGGHRDHPGARPGPGPRRRPRGHRHRDGRRGHGRRLHGAARGRGGRCPRRAGRRGGPLRGRVRRRTAPGPRPARPVVPASGPHQKPRPRRRIGRSALPS